MDPGARADRRSDRRADARGHGRQLALTLRSRRARVAAASSERRAGAGGWVLLAALATTSPATPAQTAAAPVPAPSTAPTAGVAHYAWHLPRGFPIPAVPADNPMSDAKVALGERLFFEPRLSVTGRYSCASCHDPARAFSDGRPVALGATGEALPHNALTLVNVAYNVSFGWSKPGVRSLEAQMLEPLLNEHPPELGLKGREAAVGAQLAADPSYAAAFAASFAGDPGPQGEGVASVSFDRMVKAIAAFERTLMSGNSPFDRYAFGGEHGALPDAAKRGMALFFSARIGCAGCHSGFNFAGNWRDAQGDTGSASFATNGTSAIPTRVPTLRNIALTAPYMHDGRFATLEAVLEHYSGLGQRRRSGARLDKRLPHAPFTAGERADLGAFLEALTDESFVERFGGHARPR